MKTETTKKTPSLRCDIILISALLVIALASLLVTLLTREQGNFVEVEINHKTVASYPLDRDAEYELNGGTNILIIEGGEAYVTYADCPGQQCVRKGRIRYVGESIICAHNEVTVTVRGNSDGGVDLVS